ncbi:MAG: hypothetical protein HGA44_10515 [Cellulomonadaceae bacterium]|nr:hypothetical protein [Cellulomonadaceae bacterium]
MSAARARRRITLTAAVAVAVAIGLAVPQASATERPAVISPPRQPVAAAVSPTPPSPRTDPTAILLGVHEALGAYPDNETAVTALEGRLDRRVDVDRWFSRWDEKQPANPVASDAARGRLPMLSISPKKLDGTVITWAAIARGDQDATIRAQAAGVGSLGTTVYLTFHHEADLNSSAWGTPADYRAAWRHYVEVFRAAGVTNVLWTWTMTLGSFTSPPSTAGADAFYPGDDVVDRVGVDAYNWAACSAGKSQNWHSLTYVTAAFRTWATARGKVAVLPEWGSVEDPADPNRKAAWIHEAFTLFRGWPELEVASYYDATGTCAWSLSTSTAAATAFAQEASAATSHGRPTAWLTPSTKLGAAPLAVSFDMARSTGAGSVNRTGITSWSLDFGDGSAPVTGTGQPAKVSHTYAAGTFQPRLTVTDASGSTAFDSRPVRSAAKPVLTGGESNVTSTSATLSVWVSPQGLSATVRVAWVLPSGVEAGHTDLAVGAQTGTQKLVVPVTGLRAGTRYAWTATATSAAGTTVLARTVETPGPPTIRAVPAVNLTRTTATVKLRVTTHLLATTAWVEWGPGLTRRTPDVALAGATYEKGTEVALTGLTAATTYSYRVVARNALGTTYGPTQTFRTTS